MHYIFLLEYLGDIFRQVVGCSNIFLCHILHGAGSPHFWPFIGSFSTCCFLGRVPHIYYGYDAYFCSANSLILVLSQFRLIVRGKNASCDGSGLSLHENILLICYLFANLLWTCNFCLIFIFKQFFLWFLCDFLLYFSHWDYEMYRTNIWVWNCLV